MAGDIDSLEGLIGRSRISDTGVNVRNPLETGLLKDVKDHFVSPLQEGRTGAMVSQLEARRERGGEKARDLQGFVGQSNEMTFARALGGDRDETNMRLVASFFQFQQSDVFASTIERNPVADITTQSLDLDTTADNIAARMDILAPNEIAIAAGGDKVQGIKFPDASFHPKAAAREFMREGEPYIMATVGSQNVTSALRQQSIESQLVFQAPLRNKDKDSFAKVAQEIQTAVTGINRIAKEGGRASDIRRDIHNQVQLSQLDRNRDRQESFVVLNQRFLTRLEETLSYLHKGRDNIKDDATIYLSFGTLKALFDSDEESNTTIGNIKKHLNYLVTKGRSNINVKVLTKVDSRHNRNLLDNIDNIQEGSLLNNLVANRSFINVPGGNYHDKSFAIIKDDEDSENGQLLAYGVGSAQFSEKSLHNNVEMGVFFRGSQIIGRNTPGHEDHDDILKRLDLDANMPISKRYQNLAVEGTTPVGFLPEGQENLSRSGIEQLEKSLKSLKKQYGSDKVEISRRYNFSLGEEKEGGGIRPKLVGLDVKVKDALGTESIKTSFTVKREGKRNIVVASDKDVSISGSVFVNRTEKYINLQRLDESQEELYTDTLRPQQSANLSSIESATGIVGTMIRSLDYQTRFSTVNQVFRGLTTDEQFSGVKSLLLRELNEAFSRDEDTSRIQTVETLPEAINKISQEYRDEQSRANLVNRFTERILSTGSDENILRSQRLTVENNVLGILKQVGYFSEEDSSRVGDKLASELLLAMQVEHEGYVPLQHLRYRLIQEVDSGRIQYQTLNKEIAKETEEKAFESFLRSGETGGSFLQMLARRPVYGIEEEDISKIDKSATYTVGQWGNVATHALLNPLAVKHGDLITTSDRPLGGAFFRAISSVSYRRQAGTQSLGGLRQIRTIDEDEDRRAAAFYDFDILSRGMVPLSAISKAELRHREFQTLKNLGIDIGTAKGNILSRFDTDPDDEEQQVLFLMPFRKSDQLSQRLKNMIGTRPMKEVNRDVVRKIYSGQYVSPEELSEENFNVGQITSALPEEQFEYVKQVLSEEGSYEEALRRLKKETQGDPGALNRGYVEQSRPRMIAISMGTSHMSDFSFKNPQYEAEFSYRTNKYIKFNTSEVHDPVQKRAEIHERLKPGTVIFSNRIELEGSEESDYLQGLRSRFNRYLGEEGGSLEQQNLEKAVRRLRQDIPETLRGQLVPDIKGGDLRFFFERGAYQFEPDGTPIYVGELDEQGYLNIGEKSKRTPFGTEVEPIKFKVPASSERYERGVSVITDITKGEASGRQLSIGVQIETIKRPGTLLREGMPNIKAPGVYLGEDEHGVSLFTEVARSLDKERYGYDPKDYTPKVTRPEGEIQGKDIYGVYGPGSIKSFNVESGAYLLGFPETRQELKGMSGQQIALSLATMFLEDVTSQGRPFAELVQSELRKATGYQQYASNPFSHYLRQKTKEIGKKIESYEEKGGDDSLDVTVGGKASAVGKKSNFKGLGLSAFGILAFAESDKPVQGVSTDGTDFGQFDGLIDNGSAWFDDVVGEDIYSGSDLKSVPIYRVRTLVEKALGSEGEQEAKKAKETLKTRARGLIEELETNEQYGTVLQGEKSNARIGLNITSPLVRGASLFSYLASTGRQLMFPSFVDTNKAVYDMPDRRMGSSSPSERQRLARDIINLERNEDTTEGFNQGVKENIEFLVHLVTNRQFRSIIKRSQDDEEARQEIENVLAITHSQIQNQLFIQQPVNLNPSQSLVATGMRDVGRLEYQYMQSFSKTLTREFVHDISEDEIDVRTAYAVISNITQGRSFPITGEGLDLQSRTINDFSTNQLTSRVNILSMALPHLPQKEENLSREFARRLLDVQQGNRFQEMVQKSLDVKFAIREFQEGYKSVSFDERLGKIESALTEFNTELESPIKIRGLLSEEGLNRLKGAVQTFQVQQEAQSNNFRDYLRARYPDLLRRLKQADLEDIVYREDTGTLKVESPDQLEQQWREERRLLKEKITQSRDTAVPSAVLSAMRSIWSVGEEMGRSDIKAEVSKTQEIVVPKVKFSDGYVRLAHPSEEPPTRLLLPGLNVIDPLKLEYPGFTDKMLRLTVEARQLNAELADIDSRLAQATSPIQITTDQEAKMKRRDTLAIEIRKEAAEQANTVIAEQSTGDYAEAAGTSFAAVRSFLVNPEETAFGDRLEAVKPSKARSDKQDFVLRAFKKLANDALTESLTPLREKIDRLKAQQEELSREYDELYEKYQIGEKREKHWEKRKLLQEKRSYTQINLAAQRKQQPEIDQVNREINELDQRVYERGGRYSKIYGAFIGDESERSRLLRERGRKVEQKQSIIASIRRELVGGNRIKVHHNIEREGRPTTFQQIEQSATPNFNLLALPPAEDQGEDVTPEDYSSRLLPPARFDLQESRSDIEKAVKTPVWEVKERRSPNYNVHHNNLKGINRRLRDVSQDAERIATERYSGRHGIIPNRLLGNKLDIDRLIAKRDTHDLHHALTLHAEGIGMDSNQLRNLIRQSEGQTSVQKLYSAVDYINREKAKQYNYYRQRQEEVKKQIETREAKRLKEREPFYQNTLTLFDEQGKRAVLVGNRGESELFQLLGESRIREELLSKSVEARDQLRQDVDLISRRRELYQDYFKVRDTDPQTARLLGLARRRTGEDRLHLLRLIRTSLEGQDTMSFAYNQLFSDLDKLSTLNPSDQRKRQQIERSIGRELSRIDSMQLYEGGSDQLGEIGEEIRRIDRDHPWIRNLQNEVSQTSQNLPAEEYYLRTLQGEGSLDDKSINPETRQLISEAREVTEQAEIALASQVSAESLDDINSHYGFTGKQLLYGVRSRLENLPQHREFQERIRQREGEFKTRFINEAIRNIFYKKARSTVQRNDQGRLVSYPGKQSRDTENRLERLADRDLVREEVRRAYQDEAWALKEDLERISSSDRIFVHVKPSERTVDAVTEGIVNLHRDLSGSVKERQKEIDAVQQQIDEVDFAWRRDKVRRDTLKLYREALIDSNRTKQYAKEKLNEINQRLKKVEEQIEILDARENAELFRGGRTLNDVIEEQAYTKEAKEQAFQSYKERKQEVDSRREEINRITEQSLTVDEKVQIIKDTTELNQKTRDELVNLLQDRSSSSPDSGVGLLDKLKRANKLIDEAMVYRGGAPSNMNAPLNESEKIKKIITTSEFNRRAEASGSLMLLAHEQARTAMIMPGFGSYFAQQGDFDGDTYMALISKARTLYQNQDKAIQEALALDRDIQQLDRQIRKLEGQEVGDYLVNRDAELNELRSKLQTKQEARNEKEEEIQELDNQISPIVREQERRQEQRSYNLEASIRRWQQGYTGFPEFIFQETDRSGSLAPSKIGSHAERFGFSREEEVFSKHELAEWMNAMRGINEQLIVGRPSSNNIDRILRHFDTNRKENRFIGSLEAEDSNLADMVKDIRQQYGGQLPDRETLIQEVTKREKIESAMSDYYKFNSNLRGKEFDPTSVEGLMGVIGTSGGQLLGEAYNAFVPMMQFASAGVALRRALEERDVYDRFKQSLADKLGSSDRAESILGSDQTETIKELDESYRATFQLVENIQVIIRDDALKPHGGGDLTQNLREKYQSGEIPEVPMTGSENTVRQRGIGKYVFSNLGTPIDLEKEDSFETSTIGIMRLAGTYIQSEKLSDLRAMIKGHLGEGESLPFLNDVIRHFEENQGRELSESSSDEDIRMAFESALVDLTARTQASFQANSNLPEEKAEETIKKMYAKSLDVLDRHSEQDKAYKEADIIAREVERRLGVDRLTAPEEFDQRIDQDLAKNIQANIIYQQLTQGPRKQLLEQQFRTVAELSQAHRLLRESEEPDQALAEEYDNQMKLIAMQTVAQRGHLETQQQHHRMSLAAMRSIDRWAKELERQGIYTEEAFNPNAPDTEEGRRKLQARASIIYGLISGFGFKDREGGLNEEEKAAFVQTLFEGYSSDPAYDNSIFGEMLSKSEGVEKQIKHIEALDRIERQKMEATDLEEIRKIEQEYEQHLNAIASNLSPEVAEELDTDYRTTEEIGQERRQQLEQAKREALKTSREGERFEREVQRRIDEQVTGEQVIDQGSDFLANLAAPAILGLLGSGVGESLDERAALFAYDVAQATAEMDDIGRMKTTYTLQTQKHLFGGKDLSPSATGFRLQRIRMAMESQETMSEGVLAALAQESSVRAFGQVAQFASRQVDRVTRGNRTGTNIASMGFELLGDALMMAGSRMFSGVATSPKPERELPDHLVEFLAQRAEEINEMVFKETDEISESGSGDVETYVYNERVDMIASARPTIIDDVQTGVVVLDDEGRPIPTAEPANQTA
jgi:hypothetical protein